MISVIIPTLNEEARIGALLKVLARETVSYEVILVDGGSEDKTTNKAA
ncbi:MAG: glycosyltransferase, partial [Pseudomonadota bacterium]|nr:glycosyltransferase [Pseudomonadota bacterium]